MTVVVVVRRMTTTRVSTPLRTLSTTTPPTTRVPRRRTAGNGETTIRAPRGSGGGGGDGGGGHCPCRLPLPIPSRVVLLPRHALRMCLLFSTVATTMRILPASGLTFTMRSMFAFGLLLLGAVVVRALASTATLPIAARTWQVRRGGGGGGLPARWRRQEGHGGGTREGGGWAIGVGRGRAAPANGAAAPHRRRRFGGHHRDRLRHRVVGGVCRGGGRTAAKGLRHQRRARLSGGPVGGVRRTAGRRRWKGLVGQRGGVAGRCLLSPTLMPTGRHREGSG